MDYHVEKVASPNAIVGEGPVWSAEEQKLYWTDIQGGKLFKHDPKTGSNNEIHNGVEVGGFRFNDGGGLALATWKGVMLWNSDEDFKWLKTGNFEGTDKVIKINDCTSGPDGSLYCGTDTSNWENDTLFRLNPDSSIDIIDEGITLCNGMGFSPDETKFYNTDTLAKIIYKWDYNKSTRSLSNKSILVKYEGDGITDGMTVDSEGFIWSAIWWGSKVIRFDPDGKIEREINLPATQTSCPMFGGKDLNELYVTTAGADFGGEPTGLEPEGYDFGAYRGGDLLRIPLDIQGKLEYKTKF
jgi:D-xylonolactonase